MRIEFEDLKPAGELPFAIAREQESLEPGHEVAARRYLELFLMQCCRRALKNGFLRERAPRASPLARLERVRQYLDQNYAEPHTLGELAKRAGLSRTYLCRSFKRYTGRRVFDYLIERRIQAAMMRLRGTSDKIASIALESGFSDTAYFNRKFRRAVGMTPREYRGPSAARARSPTWSESSLVIAGGAAPMLITMVASKIHSKGPHVGDHGDFG